MIITLKVTLIRGLYFENDWSANIELDESSTLIDLHDAIQTAVDFEEDHAFSFFLSRTDRSRSREHFHDDEDSIDTQKMSDMFPLPAKQSLFYLFDWGDEWVFKISPTRKRPHEPIQGVTYPRIESELGVKPEQYPACDEDEYE